jgi:HK97 family phage prohead protease
MWPVDGTPVRSLRGAMQTAAMDYDFKLSDEHVRVDEEGNLIVSGWASNFDVDRVGDTVTRTALDAALTRFMTNPVMLYDHKYSHPAGVVTKARVTDRGLWIEAKLPKPESGLPLHYWNMVRRGFMRALSIGGVWKRDALRRLVEIDLREISVASVGVNAGTLLSAQTAKAFGDDSDPCDRWDVRLAVAEFRRDIHREQAALLRAQLRL